MVLTKIVQEIFKRALPHANKIFVVDKVVLTKAYTGFKHKSQIVSGIRHGLVIGSGVGSFINLNNDDELDGSLQPFSPPSTQDKARSGRRGRYYRGRRNTSCYRPNRNRRRSSFGKYKRMRNRF